jgi:hypothetical protein
LHNNSANSAVDTDSTVADVITAIGFLALQAVVMISAVAGVHDAVDVLTASGLLTVSGGPCY